MLCLLSMFPTASHVAGSANAQGVPHALPVRGHEPEDSHLGRFIPDNWTHIELDSLTAARTGRWLGNDDHLWTWPGKVERCGRVWFTLGNTEGSALGGFAKLAEANGDGEQQPGT